MAYATEEQLTAYPVIVPSGSDAGLLLTRASRDVDRALLTAVYDATDADVIVALRDATCEQVAGNLAAGDRTGTGAAPTPSGFSIGKISVQRQGRSGTGSTSQADKINGLWPQAWQILQQAGLTGHGPQTW